MDRPTLEDLRPHLVCSVADPDLGHLGYLVLDRYIDPAPCGGGIRLAPGLTVEEIAECARAMTLKWSFFSFCHGGAKAGITAADSILRQRRRDVMTAFGKALGPLIKRRVYFTGTDLGTTIEDVNALREALGYRPYTSPRANEGYYTALTVLESVRQCALHRGLNLSGATVAIEGFGKVGSRLAQLLAEAGAKLVAVSTSEWAVHDARGLDVSRLVPLAHLCGEEFWKAYGRSASMGHADLLALDVDVLIPGARTWAIDADNAGQVRARMVVPAANTPLTARAERILDERGIFSMPDFVANCGGVLCPRMIGQGFDEADVRKMVAGPFAAKVARLLTTAKARGVTPSSLARSIAWRNFEEMNERMATRSAAGRVRGLARKVRETGARGVAERIGAALYSSGRLRTETTKRLALRRFTARLSGPDEEALEPDADFLAAGGVEGIFSSSPPTPPSGTPTPTPSSPRRTTRSTGR